MVMTRIGHYWDRFAMADCMLSMLLADESLPKEESDSTWALVGLLQARYFQRDERGALGLCVSNAFTDPYRKPPMPATWTPTSRLSLRSIKQVAQAVAYLATVVVFPRLTHGQ